MVANLENLCNDFHLRAGRSSKFTNDKPIRPDPKSCQPISKAVRNECTQEASQIHYNALIKDASEKSSARRGTGGTQVEITKRFLFTNCLHRKHIDSKTVHNPLFTSITNCGRSHFRPTDVNPNESYPFDRSLSAADRVGRNRWLSAIRATGHDVRTGCLILNF